jgi:hypothetical protein
MFPNFMFFAKKFVAAGQTSLRAPSTIFLGAGEFTLHS